MEYSMSRKGWHKFFHAVSWGFPFYRLVDDAIMKDQDRKRDKDRAEKLRAAIEGALEAGYTGTGDIEALREADPDTYALIGVILLQSNGIKWDPPWPRAHFEGPYEGAATQQWQVHLGDVHRLLVTRMPGPDVDGDFSHSLTLITTTRDRDTIRNSQVKAWHDVTLPVGDRIVIEVVQLAFEAERGKV